MVSELALWIALVVLSVLSVIFGPTAMLRWVDAFSPQLAAAASVYTTLIVVLVVPAIAIGWLRSRGTKERESPSPVKWSELARWPSEAQLLLPPATDRLLPDRR